MNFLPVPTKRYSWIVTLILVIILFPIYYVGLYPTLLNKYILQFNEGAFENQNTDLRSLGIKVTTRIPKYIYQSETVWMYITVENTKDQTVDVDLYLPLSTMSETILLPSLDNNNVYEPSISLKNIKPHSTLIGRIPIIAQSGISISNIWMQASIKDGTGNQLPLDKMLLISGETDTQLNNLEAMKHSFLEYILLPPWSNWLLVILAAFSAYLTQNKRGFKNKENDNIRSDCDSSPDNEPDIFAADWWKCLCINFIWAFITLIVVALIIVMMLNFVVLIAITILGLGALEFVNLKKHIQSTKVKLSKELEDIYNKDNEEDELYKWAARIEKKDYAKENWVWSSIVKILGHPKEIQEFLGKAKKRKDELVDRRKKSEEEKRQPNKSQGKNKNKSKPTENSIKNEQGEISVALGIEGRNLNYLGEKISDDLGNLPPYPLENNRTKPKEIYEKINNAAEQEKLISIAIVEQKKIGQFSLFKNRDQIIAERIDKIIDDVRGTSRESEILTDCENDLNSKYYSDRTGMLRLIFGKRDVPLEIRALMAKIKERTLEVEKEKMAKEKKLEKQKRMKARRSNGLDKQSPKKDDKGSAIQASSKQVSTENSSNSQVVSSSLQLIPDEELKPDTQESEGGFAPPENQR